MNLLSLLIAPLQAVVLFFAPHASTVKPSGVRLTVRAQPNAAVQAMQPARASHVAYPRSKTLVNAKPIHKVRVVRNVDASLPADRAGRMVVSGRFADVCAELDKLASMEVRAA